MKHLFTQASSNVMSFRRHCVAGFVVSELLSNTDW